MHKCTGSQQRVVQVFSCCPGLVSLLCPLHPLLLALGGKVQAHPLVAYIVSPVRILAPQPPRPCRQPAPPPARR
jgi:hypothetical protein